MRKTVVFSKVFFFSFMVSVCFSHKEIMRHCEVVGKERQKQHNTNNRLAAIRKNESKAFGCGLLPVFLLT